MLPCEGSGGKELNLSKNEIIWKGWSSAPNWEVQGAPGMAETLGDPHKGWCWLDFLLPNLIWDSHSG